MPEQQTEVGVQDEQIVAPPQQYIPEIVAPVPILAQPLATLGDHLEHFKVPCVLFKLPILLRRQVQAIVQNLLWRNGARTQQKHSPFCAVKTRVFSPY
jgi:hypothetical protein